MADVISLSSQRRSRGAQRRQPLDDGTHEVLGTGFYDEFERLKREAPSRALVVAALVHGLLHKKRRDVVN